MVLVISFQKQATSFAEVEIPNGVRFTTPCINSGKWLTTIFKPSPLPRPDEIPGPSFHGRKIDGCSSMKAKALELARVLTHQEPKENGNTY